MAEKNPLQELPAKKATRQSVLSRLFEEHNQRLIGFCRRGYSEQEAREAAQESYARLLNLGKPETMGFLCAYVFKTAANLAFGRLRHRSTIRSVEPQLQVSQELAEPRTPEALTSTGQQAAVADYPDGRFKIRFEGRELPYKEFDRLSQVHHGDIVNNKRLG
jgi:DNA-directed RNA polymerase specialized sigma24 family protein